MLATFIPGVPEPMPLFAVDSFLAETAALQPLVRAVIASVLGESQQHPDVEDGAHETLRRAIEGRARLREGERLRPWIVGIARHVALDTLRARRRSRVRHSTNTEASTPEIERAADSSPDAFERLERAERIRRILAAMETLPAPSRTAITLFHVEGLSYQAIAHRMGVPIGSVATWVCRGRKAIVEALREEES